MKSIKYFLYLILLTSIHITCLGQSILDALPDTSQQYNFPIQEIMNEEVTTGTRQISSIMESPVSISVITKEDIEKYGYNSLQEALARVSEVFVHYSGHNHDTDFRGFFSNNTQRRVLYLLDGIKLNDQFNFGDFYADVVQSLHNVEKIEVIRGSGASLYGNNSVLGVVNIITKKATEKAFSKVYLENNNFPCI